MKRTHSPSDDTYDATGCRNLLEGYLQKIFDFSDYAYNITAIMIGTKEEYWSSCLNTIPPDVVARYLEYLHEEIEAQDFKPFPYIYIFGSESDAEIEKTKMQLRPKYVALVEFTKRNLNSMKD